MHWVALPWSLIHGAEYGGLTWTFKGVSLFEPNVTFSWKPSTFLWGRKAEHKHTSLQCSLPLYLVWFFNVTQIKFNQEVKSKPGMLWQRVPNNRKKAPFPASSRCAWLSSGESLEAQNIRYLRYKCSGKSIYFSVQEQWQTKGVFWKFRVHSYSPRI